MICSAVAMDTTDEYYYSEISRDCKIWICYVREDQAWTLSTNPYLPNSIDLGIRISNKVHARCVLNFVSQYEYGSAEMIGETNRWIKHFQKFPPSAKGGVGEITKERQKSIIEQLYENGIPE